MLNEKTIRQIAKKAMTPLPEPDLESLQARIHGEPKPHVRFLYWLAAETAPCLALELGTEWGVTAEHLAAKSVYVAGVDRAVGPRVQRPNYTHFWTDSLRAVGPVARLAAAYGGIGLVFQDTAIEGQGDEWLAYSPFLARKAAWVCGDIRGAAWNLIPEDTWGKVLLDLRREWQPLGVAWTGS